MTGLQTWKTPPEFFRLVTEEVYEARTFGWGLDAAASDEDHMVSHYITVEEGGLSTSWRGRLEELVSVRPVSPLQRPVWCNPPFSLLGRFLEKAYRESRVGVTSVVLGLGSTDTEWFHSYGIRADEIWMLRGRVRFVHPITGDPGPAPRSQHAVYVYRPHWSGPARIIGRDSKTLEMIWRST